MIEVENYALRPAADELDFLLRRAEQESIAAIRAGTGPAADSHDRMATAYSQMAQVLFEEMTLPNSRPDA